MNHIEHIQEKAPLRGMKKLTAAALGALALMSAAPAMADIINFESIGSTTFNGTEVFGENGYLMEVIDTPAAGPGGVGFAGGIGNGTDPYLCEIAACPTGNSSFFYMGVNDGGLKVSREDSQAFRLYALDYAFLAPIGGLPSYSYGQLTVVGQKAGGGSLSATFDFPLLTETGNSPFLSAGLAAAFGKTYFSNITISSCLWDSGNNCVNPADNQAQFTIDNLVLAAVPEPETYAMMGLGLAAIGLVSRRRAKQQAYV